MTNKNNAKSKSEAEAVPSEWYAVIRGMLQGREWSGVTQNSSFALQVVSHCPLGASTWMVSTRSEKEAEAIIASELRAAQKYPHGPDALLPQLHDVVVYTDGGCANLAKGILASFPLLSRSECKERDIQTIPKNKYGKVKAKKAIRRLNRIQRRRGTWRNTTKTEKQNEEENIEGTGPKSTPEPSYRSKSKYKSDATKENCTSSSVLKLSSKNKPSLERAVTHRKPSPPKPAIAPLLLYGNFCPLVTDTPYQEAQMAFAKHIRSQSFKQFNDIHADKSAELFENAQMSAPSANSSTTALISAPLPLEAINDCPVQDKSCKGLKAAIKIKKMNNSKEARKLKKAKKAVAKAKSCQSVAETPVSASMEPNTNNDSCPQVIRSPSKIAKAATSKQAPLLAFGAVDNRRLTDKSEIQSKPQGSFIENEPSMGIVCGLNMSSQAVKCAPHLEFGDAKAPESVNNQIVRVQQQQLTQCSPEFLPLNVLEEWDSTHIFGGNPGAVVHNVPVVSNGVGFGISNPISFQPPMNFLAPYQHPMSFVPAPLVLAPMPWGVIPTFSQHPFSHSTGLFPGASIPPPPPSNFGNRLTRKQRASLSYDVPVGGYGVWFGESCKLNVSAPLEGKIQSSRRAELSAVATALEIVVKKVTWAKRVLIRSDAKLQDARDYIKKQEQNPFLNDDDWDLWVRIGKSLEVLKERKVDVSLEWVKGHATSYGNYRADELASSGVIQKAMKLQPCGLEMFRKHRKFVPKSYKVHEGRISKRKSKKGSDVPIATGENRQLARDTNEDIVTTVESHSDDSSLAAVPKDNTTYSAIQNPYSSKPVRVSSANRATGPIVIDLSSIDTLDTGALNIARVSAKRTTGNRKNQPSDDVVNLCSDNDNSDVGTVQKSANSREGCDENETNNAGSCDKMDAGYERDCESKFVQVSDDGENGDMYEAMQKAEEIVGLYDKAGNPNSPKQCAASSMKDACVTYDVDTGIEVFDISEDN